MKTTAPRPGRSRSGSIFSNRAGSGTPRLVAIDAWTTAEAAVLAAIVTASIRMARMRLVRGISRSLGVGSILNQARCFHIINEWNSSMRSADIGLEIRDLRLVQAIAAEGTLARASVRLNLTPSALSHHLLALEARVGAPLCARAGRQMRLTPAGARLAEAGSRVLESLAEAERAIATLEPAREVMRLATECHTTFYWLPSVLKAYEQSTPHVDVRLVPDTGVRPLTQLLAGHVDAAIVNNRLRDRRLRYLPIFKDELVAVVASSHPWARRPMVTAKEIGRASCRERV